MKLLNRCAHEIIHHHVEPIMKAPLNNPAKPSYFCASALDLCYGDNVSHTDDGAIMRKSYGVLSSRAQASIGLDPFNNKIRHMFGTLNDLRNVMTEHVKRHYNDQGIEVNCNFNAASIKIYFNGMKVREHTDVKFNKTHDNISEQNSLLPDTPIVIMSVGDPKVLEFKEYEHTIDNNRKMGTRTVAFVQEHGTVIILDHRDEKLNKERKFWTHSSRLVDGKNGCAMTIILRVIGKEKKVHHNTGLCWDPKYYGSGKKEKQFKKAKAAISDGLGKEQYEKKVKEIDEKMRDMLRRHGVFC